MQGHCELTSPVVNMGLVYCLKNSGTAPFKIASPIFALMALQRLDKFNGFSKWQKLETIITFTNCPFMNTDQEKNAYQKWIPLWSKKT